MFLSGFIGGFFGGMGLGGGTFLIPLLSIFCNFEQHLSQGINLLAFIPLSIASLIIHFKNKFVRFYNIIYMIIPGIIFCIVGFMVSKSINGNVLRKVFGIFLIGLSIYMFISGKKKRR